MIGISELAAELTRRYGLGEEDAQSFVGEMFGVIAEQLAKGDANVKVKGLGTFKLSQSGRVTFAPEMLLRDRVNRPFAQFETVALNDGVDFSELDGDEEGQETDADGEEKLAETEDEAEDTEETDGGGEPVESVEKEETAEIVEEEEMEEEPEHEKPQEPNLSPVTVAAEEHRQPSLADAEEPHPQAAEQQKPAEQPDVVDEQQSADVQGNSQRIVAERLMAARTKHGVPPVCRQRNPRVMWLLTVASFVLLLFIGASLYFIYMRIEAKNHALEMIEKKATSIAPATYPKIMPVKRLPVSDTTTAARQTAVKAEDNGATRKESAASSYVYDSDVRVRTGAYVIDGTECTVKVKPGQTIASISKAYLGDGMECYVEAYNHCSEVKPGDTIKIPHLRLKAKRRH